MSEPIKEFLRNIPTVEQIQKRLAQNLRERDLLRQMLKVAQKNKEAKNVS